MEEDGEVMQPIKTMCRGKILRCVAGKRREVERAENVNSLLKMLSGHVDESLVELQKEILKDWHNSQSLISVHVSVLRSGFVASEYYPLLTDSAEYNSFISEILELCK